MKNVENVNFYQVDNKAPLLAKRSEAIILPSVSAFQRFKWTRKYFSQQPQEGYFIWVRRQLDYPLTTCITIVSPKIFQKPENLIVIENGLRSEIHSFCNAVKKNLTGVHYGHTKIILKEGSNLKTKIFHSWGRKDKINSSLDFVVEKKAKLTYTYRCLQTPLKLKAATNTFLEEDSSANMTVTVLAKNSRVRMNDSVFLNGEKSNGISRIRIVSDKKSEIVAKSKMVAKAAGTGHVDCLGLLLADNSTVNAIPKLVNQNKKASLTHEASVGKISEENLNYLRCRGLTEDEAINLIVTGFLGEEDPLVIKGQTISSKLYM